MAALAKYRLSLPLILPLVHDALPHAVDILLPRVLPLPHVYVGHDLLPAGLHVEPFGLFPISFLLPHVIRRPLPLFLVLPLLPLLQLLPRLLFACLLLLVLLILDGGTGTLFSLRVCWIRSSSSRIFLVSSSYSKSSNPSSASSWGGAGTAGAMSQSISTAGGLAT